jgi:imidazolonepropionase-like amidohydrolase
MKKIFTAVLLMSAILFLSNETFAQKTILIKCGKLLDTKGGKVLENQFVLLKGNTIVSISNTSTKADSTIDLSSYFVMPGMIDAHTHVLLQGDITSEDYDVRVLKESIPYRTLRASKSAEKSILNGFTTIRDLGTEGAGFADVDVKKAINKGVITGPRMQVATLAMNTTGHYPLKASDYAWELKFPFRFDSCMDMAGIKKSSYIQMELNVKDTLGRPYKYIFSNSILALDW